jgi:hypothetical protein
LTKVLQILGGIVFIAGLLAVQALVLYLIARAVLMIFRCVPLVGKRHRHRDWDRLNPP